MENAGDGPTNAIVEAFNRMGMDRPAGVLAFAMRDGAVGRKGLPGRDAVAADLLARREAMTLAKFGAGNQARFEVAALTRIRPINTVLVVARPSPRCDAFFDRINNSGQIARAVSAEEAVRAADIVVTATPAREPLFEAAWIGPGTHVLSMGSDASGKRPASTNCRKRCCRGRVGSATCCRSPFGSATSSTPPRRSKLAR
jgi:ornithine cyclodeaminase/alanine dehydrogenase-like protein (mu-crystallin family)